MDRRTVLALVLMFSVLIGWNILFAPKPPPVDPSAGTDASTTAGDTTPSTENPGSAADLLPPSESPPPRAVSQDAPRENSSFESGPDEMGRRVQVETDRFLAEIDLAGGDILSWKLRDYPDLEGHPVDLVSPTSLGYSTQRAHALRLVVDGAPLDLRSVPFQCDVSSLILDGDRPQGRLELKADGPDGRLTLEYVFQNDTFGFDVGVRYETEAVDPPSLAWEVSFPGGIANTEPDTTTEYQEYRAVALVGADFHKTKFTDLKGTGEKGRRDHIGTVSWAGTTSRYFGSLVVLPEPTPGATRFDGHYGRRLQTFSAAINMDRSRVSSLSYSVFMGPLRSDLLASYAGEVTRIIDLGPGFFRPVSDVTVTVMKGLYKVIPNYGWVIVLISVLTKLMFYGLTKKSTQSMRAMQEIQPEMQRIKEKFKDDQKAQSEAMMALYKERGVNPVAGCLPLLVQMPVFIALFHVLRKTIELRQAGWFGWINDLSRPDVLATLPFALPHFGDKLSLLPILMAIGMWAQTKLSTPSGPAATGTMAMQAKMMTTIMPIFMFVIFYNSPSGLVLYWLVNTVLTAAQTWKIHRELSPSGLTPDPKAA